MKDRIEELKTQIHDKVNYMEFDTRFNDKRRTLELVDENYIEALKLKLDSRFEYLNEQIMKSGPTNDNDGKETKVVDDYKVIKLEEKVADLQKEIEELSSNKDLEFRLSKRLT